MKYSNNSLEKNIKKRNQYKTFKKHCFSWRGLWSNRTLFFENISELKLKLINHYTKSFMKPLLVPFGLIPNQIMSKECPKREKKENIIKGKEITDSTNDFKIFKCKTHKNIKNNYILKIGTNGEKLNIFKFKCFY